MNRLAQWSVFLSGVFFAHAASAEQTGIIAGENMVMLPLEVPAAPQPMPPLKPQVTPQDDNMVAAPVAEDDNMVMLPLQTATGEQPFKPVTGPSYVEAGMNVASVSANQGDWLGQFAKGQIQTDSQNRWNAEVQHEKAFHDAGTYVDVGNTHIFDDDWFSDVTVGMGTKASFFSRYRADADINRRLLDARNMVGTLGVTYMQASEIYKSIGLFGGLSYYFDTPWIAQIGIRSDRSTPGGVYATSGFGALTYGFQKKYYLTGRASYGREAYQLTGPTPITNAFNSGTLGLNWREWLGEDWGYNLGTEYYKNPTYHRTGGTLSFFKEF